MPGCSKKKARVLKQRQKVLRAPSVSTVGAPASDRKVLRPPTASVFWPGSVPAPAAPAAPAAPSSGRKVLRPPHLPPGGSEGAARRRVLRPPAGVGAAAGAQRQRAAGAGGTPTLREMQQQLQQHLRQPGGKALRQQLQQMARALKQ